MTPEETPSPYYPLEAARGCANALAIMGMTCVAGAFIAALAGWL